MIKQLKMREYSAHFDFSLNCYVLVILIQQCLQAYRLAFRTLLISSETQLTWRHKQHVTVTQMFPRLYIRIAWEK